MNNVIHKYACDVGPLEYVRVLFQRVYRAILKVKLGRDDWGRDGIRSFGENFILKKITKILFDSCDCCL